MKPYILYYTLFITVGLSIFYLPISFIAWDLAWPIHLIKAGPFYRALFLLLFGMPFSFSAMAAHQYIKEGSRRRWW